MTIAVSVIISAFNALTLSPALGGLAAQAQEGSAEGCLRGSFNGFNNLFGRATNGYVSVCGSLIRKADHQPAAARVIGLAGCGIGPSCRPAFCRRRTRAIFTESSSFPSRLAAAQLDDCFKQIEDILLKTPGRQICTSMVGFTS